ncbi:MAG: hypothetical protein P8M30_02190 [Planctomycetaceae bacterium]|nr:hypothetical protein [bacterium]MDC0273574.1 hypothetical protein [Planctomycetaceae bacterium]MDG2388107.1 hypothetical protein [Planctomycetaceae bacterium]
MRNFDLTSHIGRLREIGECIEEGWNETAESWTDSNSETFEKEHLQPFFTELSNALSVMQRMSDLTRQAQRDCAPDRESDYA